jgi:hypothetical protein
MSFETELEQLFERYNARLYDVKDYGEFVSCEITYNNQDGTVGYLMLKDFDVSLEYIGEK